MNKKIFVMVLLIIILLVFILPNMNFVVNAANAAGDDITSGLEGIYKKQEGSNFIEDRAGKILGLVQIAGTGIAVIMLTVIGIKYMVSSVQEKAQLKETLVPYVIGAILLFAGTNILTIIVNFIREIE